MVTRTKKQQKQSAETPATATDTIEVSQSPDDPVPDGVGGGTTDDSLDGVTVESIIEALLFATDVPIPAAKLAQLVGTGGSDDMKNHIECLNARYEAHGSSFRIEAIAKGFQMLTLPTYDRWVAKLQKSRSDTRLSQAALETLAVVAYKQPALRADIEAVRGVACGDMLVRLREMNLVRIVGRADEIGRPLLYGTTNKFLDAFGLGSLKDLPRLDPDKPAASWPPLNVARNDEPAADAETAEVAASDIESADDDADVGSIAD